MKLLALDTSSDACTVAVGNGAATWHRHETAAKEHTRLLLPMISETLRAANLGYSDLDAVVLGNGPGSFIGMRIAAAVAQGIAFAAGIRVVPVSSMAAVAAAVLADSDAEYAAVAQDAHMQQVYFGLYRRSASNVVEVQGTERLADQGTLVELSGQSPATCVAVGAGWTIYPALLAANKDRVTRKEDYVVPDAREVLRLGALAWSSGASIDPADVNPAYLRHKVAAVPAQKSP